MACHWCRVTSVSRRDLVQPSPVRARVFLDGHLQDAGVDPVDTVDGSQRRAYGLGPKEASLGPNSEAFGPAGNARKP